MMLRDDENGDNNSSIEDNTPFFGPVSIKNDMPNEARDAIRSKKIDRDQKSPEDEAVDIPKEGLIVTGGRISDHDLDNLGPSHVNNCDKNEDSEKDGAHQKTMTDIQKSNNATSSNTYKTTKRNDEDVNEIISIDSSAIHESKNAKQVRNSDAFLLQLHHMIDAAEIMGMKWVISWTSNGEGFTINDEKAFIEKLLPLFFDQMSKLTSFHRSLNRAGIKKVRKGPEKGIWRQEDNKFYRGSHIRATSSRECYQRRKTYPTVNLSDLIPGREIMEPQITTDAAATRSEISSSTSSMMAAHNEEINGDSYRGEATNIEEFRIDRDLDGMFGTMLGSITTDMLEVDPDEISLAKTSAGVVCIHSPSIQQGNRKLAVTEAHNQNQNSSHSSSQGEGGIKTRQKGRRMRRRRRRRRRKRKGRRIK